jgi:hypothetical protein
MIKKSIGDNFEAISRNSPKKYDTKVSVAVGTTGCNCKFNHYLLGFLKENDTEN